MVSCLEIGVELCSVTNGKQSVNLGDKSSSQLHQLFTSRLLTAALKKGMTGSQKDLSEAPLKHRGQSPRKNKCMWPNRGTRTGGLPPHLTEKWYLVLVYCGKQFSNASSNYPGPEAGIPTGGLPGFGEMLRA